MRETGDPPGASAVSPPVLDRPALLARLEMWRRLRLPRALRSCAIDAERIESTNPCRALGCAELRFPEDRPAANREVGRAGHPSEFQEQKLTHRCTQHGMAGKLGTRSMAGHGHGRGLAATLQHSRPASVTCPNDSPLPARASITGSCVWERSDLNELKALLLPLCRSLHLASCLTPTGTAWTVWTSTSTQRIGTRRAARSSDA